MVLSFFFNDTATTEIYTLSLHDALPISAGRRPLRQRRAGGREPRARVPLSVAACRPRGADAVHIDRGVRSPRRRGAACNRGVAVGGRPRGCSPEHLSAR